MESTNISVKKEKPYKINLTVGMSFLALFCCLLGIFLIYSNLTPAQEDGSNEYIVSSVYLHPDRPSSSPF